MMAVLNGKVRISLSSAGGKEIVLATLQEGEVFGEIAMLDGKERTADAQANTDCDLAILERRDVLAVLEKHPSACLRLVEVFCQRMRLTDERIGEVAMLQLPARLARAFLRIANEQMLPRTWRCSLSVDWARARVRYWCSKSQATNLCPPIP